jgi:multimeric flavodoxin WrbA/uncharacterized Zn finger protein (UPF0148 family)
MRKILGVSASRRVWGNCEASVKQMLAAARGEGARVAFTRLTDLDIQACKGCFQCIREGGRCPTGDDLYRFLDEVESADDMVLASPVYFLSPPAVLVGLLDRLLTVAAYMDRSRAPRRAVTMTLMGNRRWRGVAEPLVNLTASLLGFEIVESMSLVAEGPGEILGQRDAVDRLVDVGRRLAGDMPVAAHRTERVCPVCGSDFFRIEPPLIICPVCGLRGDLATYAAAEVFRASAEAPRWGRGWLAAHIDSWVRPSLERYLAGRRDTLNRLRSLKVRYGKGEERGNEDVH